MTAAPQFVNGFPLPPGVEAMQIGLKVNGVWHWSRMDPPAVTSKMAPEPIQERRNSPPVPRAANERRATPAPAVRREAPPMTHGRDPGRFLITFGKFKGLTVEQAYHKDKYELASWHDYWSEEAERIKRDGGEPLGPNLEVAIEMVGAFLDGMERPAVLQPRRKS